MRNFAKAFLTLWNSALNVVEEYMTTHESIRFISDAELEELDDLLYELPRYWRTDRHCYYHYEYAIIGIQNDDGQIVAELWAIGEAEKCSTISVNELGAELLYVADLLEDKVF